MKSSCIALLALLFAPVMAFAVGQSFSESIHSYQPQLYGTISGAWSISGSKMTVVIRSGTISRSQFPGSFSGPHPSSSSDSTDSGPLTLDSMKVVVAQVQGDDRTTQDPPGYREHRFAKPPPEIAVESSQSISLSSSPSKGDAVQVSPMTVEIDLSSLPSMGTDMMYLAFLVRPAIGNAFRIDAAHFLSGRQHWAPDPRMIPATPSSTSPEGRTGPGSPGEHGLPPGFPHDFPRSEPDPPSPPYQPTGQSTTFALEDRDYPRGYFEFNWGGTFETGADKVTVHLSPGWIKRLHPAETPEIERFHASGLPRQRTLEGDIPIPPNGGLLIPTIWRDLGNGASTQIARGEPISIERLALGVQIDLIAYNYAIPIKLTELKAKHSFLSFSVEVPETRMPVRYSSALYLDGTTRPADQPRPRRQAPTELNAPPASNPPPAPAVNGPIPQPGL